MSDQTFDPVATAKAILEAFNAHDLDKVMSFFADDCTLDMPRGADPWGTRFVGIAAVREGLAGRFKGLPDVHYGGIAIGAIRTWSRPNGCSPAPGPTGKKQGSRL